jgi:hypothetical protein
VKKLISLLSCIAAFITIQLLANCSQPLDSNPGSGQSFPDTVYVTDTTAVADTITIVETMYCDRLNWYHREIIWMLQNREGLFRVEFVASTDREPPLPPLLIEIDDQQFLWDLEDSLEYVIEQFIERNASVRIAYASLQTCSKPIDVCFKVGIP